jgi:hypothetical protein
MNSVNSVIAKQKNKKEEEELEGITEEVWWSAAPSSAAFDFKMMAFKVSISEFIV